ncbi:hypothetical protein G9C85_02570 [Halorubellus sp. JP-L1]|uniref:hypothetical protein n=1 Tax=Halorubellus sp. JP-L1 TaxID=2715753 RepID=UPI00140829B8|nr:hypothetical protein [Halorubellus sp. JP-L1]NHN40522.1 hypothetical protein [Halorubellus sp. JP-L1]
MPEVFADDVDQDEVYVVKGGGEHTRYHVDEDCEPLQRSHRGSKAVPVTHRVLRGLELCGSCGSPAERAGTRPTLAATLRNDYSADDIGGHNA